MTECGCSYWLEIAVRAWTERRVGSLGWHNYNNFIFAAETHFIVKYSHLGYSIHLLAFRQRHGVTLWWKMWHLRSYPESASVPPKGFTISNRIFSSWKKSFWSFCFLQFLFFDSAERAVCPRVAIFHAIVRCVSRRCCLRCCSESRLGFFWWWWGKENGGGKSEWNRGGLSDTDSPGEGQFGRDRQVGTADPCTHINAQLEIRCLFCPCMSKLFSEPLCKWFWAAYVVFLLAAHCLDFRSFMKMAPERRPCW